jgi:hypothetical protein
MRKGLVVTLGVVAFFIAVSPVFSLAPVISCIPDIIISDAEQNQTQDRNFFIFSAAINLDELVRDDDATTKAALRWSFVETAPGTSIQINGIGGMVSPTPDQIKDPGASNLRAVNRMATFRNVTWSPVAGSLPFPNPGASSMTSTLQMYVSDGTSYTGQAMLVRTVNTGVAGTTLDAVIPQSQKSWLFTSGSDSWTWFDGSPTYPAPTHTASGGTLQMAKPSATTGITFGGWESPKNPSVALKARWGCIMRARYAMTSSVNGAGCPGFRFQALWYKVMDIGGGNFIPDFLNQDYNDKAEVQVMTTDIPPVLPFVAGREPGTAGKTFTLLYYPQQIATLMDASAIVYITCDMVDADSLNEDLGTLSIDRVDVDGFARPDVGRGTAVAALTTTNFTSWSRAAGQIAGLGQTPTTTGLVATKSATNLVITVPQGNKCLTASFSSPGAALKAGSYYRVLWTVNTDRTASSDFAPYIRTSILGSYINWFAHKNLEGGGTRSLIDSTMTPFEQWVCAPSAAPPSTTATEPMSLRFECYVLTTPNLVFNKNISGTVRCWGVQTEEFPPMQ